MHLLLLSANYSPEVTGIAPFSAGLAEHLTDGGHDVRVCASFPHFPEWRLQPADSSKWTSRETIGGVQVQRSRPLLPGEGASTVRRVIYDTSLALGALVNSLRGPRPNAVIAVSPPIQTAIVAIWLGRLWRVPTVLWAKDLVVDAGAAAGMLRSPVSRRIGAMLEAFAFRHGTAVVTIGDGMRSRLELISKRRDWIVIPDWANLAGASDAEPPPCNQKPGRLLAIHTGNLGNKMGTPMLVDAAALCPEVDFVIIGDGSEKAAVKARIEAQRTSNVQLLNLLPQHDYLRWMRDASVFLLCQKSGVRRSVLPSKLLSYMMAGRPIVASVNQSSEAARLITDAGCGLVVPPEDPKGVASALRALSAHPDEAADMGRRGRLFAQERYGRSAVLSRWTSLIEALPGLH